MPTLSRARIRFKVDAADHSSLKDLFTAATPEHWRGTDLQIELGVFFNTVLQSVANLNSLTIQLKDASLKTGPALVSKTLSAGDLDNTLDQTTWDNGTKQHALIAFTKEETDLVLGGDEKAFWVVISAITTDVPAQQFTIGVTSLRMREDGDVGAPNPAGTAFTQAQSDARYLQFGFPGLVFFGECADETIFGYWRAQQDSQVIGMQLSAQESPTGAALTVDLVNGSDVEQTKIATLADGAVVQETIFGTPLNVAAGGVIKGKFKSVGTTFPGSGLVAALIVKPG